MIILHDLEKVKSDWEHIETMMGFLRPTVHEMSVASGAWYRDRFVSVADASPFLVFWPYHVLTVLHRVPIDQIEGVEMIMRLMQEKLSIMSRRWLLGGKNSSILNELNADF